MSGKNINFGNFKLTKEVFTKTKKTLKIDNTDVSKVLLSK